MKVKAIRDIRILLAALLFIGATAAKLLLPEQTEALRLRTVAGISQDYDYESALLALRERASEGAVLEALGRLGGGAKATPTVIERETALFEPASIDELRGVRTELLPADYRLAEPVPATPAPTAIPEAVTAFLEAQAAFTDEPIPDNVCGDMPELPFEYAAPVSGYNSSGFGYRLHPLKNEVKFHFGTDFAVYGGTAVLAFADGTVSMSGWEKGYGNYVVIDHAGGWQSLYAHLSSASVLCGDAVEKGRQIALSGSTGEVTGPHLHFELRCGGVFYNPEYWLA